MSAVLAPAHFYSSVNIFSAGGLWILLVVVLCICLLMYCTRCEAQSVICNSSSRFFNYLLLYLCSSILTLSWFKSSRTVCSWSPSLLKSTMLSPKLRLRYFPLTFIHILLLGWRWALLLRCLFWSKLFGFSLVMITVAGHCLYSNGPTSAARWDTIS